MLPAVAAEPAGDGLQRVDQQAGRGGRGVEDPPRLRLVVAGDHELDRVLGRAVARFPVQGMTPEQLYESLATVVIAGAQPNAAFEFQNPSSARRISSPVSRRSRSV